MSELSQSFFFRNFPEDCDMDFVRKKFSEIGKVLDLFKPQKNDKSGKPFGFVRFEIGQDKETILNGLNNTWIGSYKIIAFIPKYDRSLQGRKIRNPPFLKNQNFATKRSFDANCGRFKPNVSYANITAGRIKRQQEPLANIRKQDSLISSGNENCTYLQYQSRNEEKHWLENCFIGTLRKGITWDNYKEEMQEECGKICSVRTIGEDVVIIQNNSGKSN